MILRDIHGNEVEVTVNPKHLAHCRECCQPLYCIYDADLRWFCWECENISMSISSTPRRQRPQEQETMEELTP